MLADIEQYRDFLVHVKQVQSWDDIIQSLVVS